MEQEHVEPTNPGEAEQAGAQFAQTVAAENVQFGPGFAVTVQAGQDINMEQSGALAVAAGKDMDLAFGGAVFMAVGGDLDVTNGGAQVMVVGGDAQINKGGAQVMIAGGNVELSETGGLLLAGQQVVARNGYYGVVLAQNVTLDGDSKVLLDPKLAAIFGAAFGAVFALLSFLFRRK
ncbi:MAG TPA: hypothetical protein VF806_07905 [Anaerolineaceae bacterium]